MLKRFMDFLAEVIPENNQAERIWILAKTDFINRYYGSALGVFWAFIKPVIQVFIYFFVFTMIFSNKIENFALYILSGILTYNFFAESTKVGMQSLRAKRYLIENIRINKLDIYLASLLTAFMGLMINFSMYFFLSIFFKVDYSLYLFFFPLLVINICMLSLGVMMLLSTINLFLRDMNHIWDMLILLGFWATPIIYGKEVVFSKVPFLVYLNPLAGIIINIREVILYGNPPIWDILIYDLLFAIVILGIALPINKKYSARAAELM